MNKTILLILVVFQFSCSEKIETNSHLVQGLWVLDSSLNTIPAKVYSEVSISPTSSKRKVFAISEDRFYSYSKRSEYFIEKDSTYIDYELNSGSNYYIKGDTMKIHNTRIMPNIYNEMILFEHNYSLNYEILEVDSFNMKLKYFNVIHYYSLYTKDVEVENKKELIKKIKENSIL